jgi:hypothetical protein
MQALRISSRQNRRCPSPTQRKAQQEFPDNKLQPLLEEAKQDKRTVLFVDAAHFVMGAFLGMLWCFTFLQWAKTLQCFRSL